MQAHLNLLKMDIYMNMEEGGVSFFSTFSKVYLSLLVTVLLLFFFSFHPDLVDFNLITSLVESSNPCC